MTVTVLAFAHLKSVVGEGALTVSLDDRATVRDLLCYLLDRYPKPDGWMKATRVAVNWQYVDPETVLHDGDEVALIPPVSGG